ncbi:MAG TPA: hypothetical protein VN608_09855 [Clostridia bacterium]|nr:hypothetical protein [Clostridia bacterium]
MMFFKDKRGSITWIFIALLVFMILVGVAIEYGRAGVIKRNVEDGLSKALNSAVQMSMLDEYRMEHISRIDTDVAATEAYSYIKTVMGLEAPSYIMQGGEGRTLFRLESIAISSTADPPHMELTCTLIIPASMFNSSTGGLEIRLNLHIFSRNQRLE